MSEKQYAKRFVDWVLSNGFVDNGSILDLGSGNGYHAEELRYNGFKVTEVDLKTGTDLNVGNLIYTEPFDGVYARSIIEYIKDPFKLMNECHRNLKVGGRIFVLTPNWEGRYRSFYGHWRRCSPFTKRSLKMLMEDVGFHTVDCQIIYEFPVIWRWTNFAFSMFWSKIVHGHYIIYVGEKL